MTTTGTHGIPSPKELGIDLPSWRETQAEVIAASRDALAAGIAKLMARPERRAELGRLGRKRVEQAYAWRQVALATARVYREIADAYRGRPARTTTSERPGSQPASRSSASRVA